MSDTYSEMMQRDIENRGAVYFRGIKPDPSKDIDTLEQVLKESREKLTDPGPIDVLDTEPAIILSKLAQDFYAKAGDVFAKGHDVDAVAYRDAAQKIIRLIGELPNLELKYTHNL